MTLRWRYELDAAVAYSFKRLHQNGWIAKPASKA
jgi:hypothetical protein